MYKLTLRLDIGSRAEDFTLTGPEGRPFRLADMLGKRIIFLTFYRGGFDRDAVRYLRELGEIYPRLRELGVEVVAVTPELPEKVKTTAGSLHLPFVLLGDPDLKVARQYDVYSPIVEWCWPAGFVIDRDGIIQYVYRGVSPPNTPPVGYLLKKFEQMLKPAEASA
jgi:thioredoxin-dependent peroxiredoxin